MTTVNTYYPNSGTTYSHATIELSTLTATTIPYLNKSAIASLTSSQLAEIPSNVISSLSTKQIGSLSTGTLLGLTTNSSPSSLRRKQPHFRLNKLPA